MKQIVCEMCGGTDLVKDGGVFVCQQCGCKYSVEEARKMMVEGVVQVEGTVSVSSIGSVDTLLELAESSLLASDGRKAIEFADKCLEINPKEVRAWLIKMRATGLLGTIGDPECEDMVAFGLKAMESAPDDDNVAETVYTFCITRFDSLLKVAERELLDFAEIRSYYLDQKLFGTGFGASDQAANVDGSFCQLIAGLISTVQTGFASLVLDDKANAVNDMAKISGFVGKMKSYVDQFEKTRQAYAKRLESYKASMTPGLEKAFRNLKEDLDETLDQVKKMRSENYFSLHPEERKAHADLQNEIAEKEKQLSNLDEEQRWLGVFDRKEKRSIENKKDEINAKLKNLKLQLKALEEKAVA
ncbi:MAG: hypothetical protein HFJ66_02445 [Eggerthellaceae bacterium]|nr:hypothetical protein [Eggerthellaceae bacterium]